MQRAAGLGCWMGRGAGGWAGGVVAAVVEVWAGSRGRVSARIRESARLTRRSAASLFEDARRYGKQLRHASLESVARATHHVRHRPRAASLHACSAPSCRAEAGPETPPPLTRCRPPRHARTRQGASSAACTHARSLGSLAVGRKMPARRVLGPGQGRPP